MKAENMHYVIERTYREGGAFQWVRETCINAVEAHATRVEYGVEWQAVAAKGVYRRTIADNGDGMTRDQLVAFLNTFGGGAKPIGGAAENFGVGSKTSLLPWNTYGIVVVSWVGGEAAMVWLQRDQDSGAYGLRCFEAQDEEGNRSIETVVLPFDDPEHGCHWGRVKPSWMGDHGTVVVLLGGGPTDDTVTGDPNRNEAGVHGIARYLNFRIWKLPAHVEIGVDTFRSDQKAKWPLSEESARQDDDGRNLRRSVRGARHFIEYPEGHQGGALQAKGSLELKDGTFADWYLWGGPRPAVHGYAPESGFVAALYKNELYNIQAHHSMYRAAGVSVTAVRQRLWLVFRPNPLDDETRQGVFPTTDRNTLKYRGGSTAGDELPLNEWANEFADRMPEEIQKALAESRTGEARSISDEAWRKRLLERFGSRWKMIRLVRAETGESSVKPVQNGGASAPSARDAKAPGSAEPGGKGGSRGPTTIGARPGPVTAKAARLRGDLPHCRATKAEDFDDPGLLAAWQPHDPEFPSGVVLLNIEHPVLLGQIAYYQAQHPDHLAEVVQEEVINVYKEVAVAKIAHSEYMRSFLPAHEVEGPLRSPQALTLALLGLISEDAVIVARLATRVGKARLTA